MAKYRKLVALHGTLQLTAAKGIDMLECKLKKIGLHNNIESQRNIAPAPIGTGVLHAFSKRRLSS